MAATKKIELEKSLSRGEQSRQQILEAAARVFKKRGATIATIRDVAKEAGVSLGTVYIYFKSWNELASKVLSYGAKKFFADVQSAIASLPADTSQRLRIETAIRAHITSIVETGDYSFANRHFVVDVPAPTLREYRRDANKYRELWRAMIEDAKKDGTMRSDVKTITVLFYIVGSITWLLEWYDPKRRSIDDVIEEFITLFFDGAHPPALKK